ncbi:MAG: DivIVA domain-containing protein [Propionibacteriaceae bacterium]|jgi:DivIVA domain-containing protein|nr:DivIVA domain-containing protein [Propionibacteriaceae bacterium]
MEWLIAIIAVAAIGLAAVAASGRLGQLGPAESDRPEPDWPDGPFTADAVSQLRFAVVPRGYAMDQVDRFCDLVRRQLADAGEAPCLSAEGAAPGIMEPDRVLDADEVMTDHGSDEAPDR